MATQLRFRKIDVSSFVGGLGFGIMIGALLCLRYGMDNMSAIMLFIGFPIVFLSYVIDWIVKAKTTTPSESSNP